MRAFFILALLSCGLGACVTGGMPAPDLDPQFPTGAQRTKKPAPNGARPPGQERYARPVRGQSWPEPRGRARGWIGAGNFSHETSTGGVTPGVDTDTRAAMYGVDFESGGRLMGGGLRIEGIVVEDDLSSFDDPNTPSVEENTRGVSVDLYPHLSIRAIKGPRFRVPIRIGPVSSFLELEDSTTLGFNQRLQYFHVGGRFEVEPEYDIIQVDEQVLSVFSVFSGGATRVGIDADLVGANDDFKSDALQVGLQFGVRYGLPGFDMSLAYVYRGTFVDESDPEVGIVINEADFEYNGVVFMFGGRW